GLSVGRSRCGLFWDVPADKQLNQPFLIGRARLRELDRIAVKFQPRRRAGPFTTPQPVPDHRYHRPQALNRLAKSDQQRANSGHAEYPGTRRRLTSRKRTHFLDVELQKFRPQVASQYSEPLSVRVLLRQMKTQFSVHKPPSDLYWQNAPGCRISAIDISLRLRQPDLPSPTSTAGMLQGPVGTTCGGARLADRGTGSLARASRSGS